MTLHRCDKCGAATRWYDEKCPVCGAARTVEIPTAPIALPRFAPSPTRRGEEIAVASTHEKTTEQPQEAAVEQEKTTEQPQQTATEQEKTTEQPQEAAVEQEKTTEQPQQTAVEQEKTTEQSRRSQRFADFRRAVDVWRSAFAPETASVTVSRGRAARYALGIVGELFVCPPCAILAAYFFTRALFADRRARYHAAMLETEKARRALAVGLGLFATFLCAFIFYVQSQEIAAPTEPTPNARLFKN